MRKFFEKKHNFVSKFLNLTEYTNDRGQFVNYQSIKEDIALFHNLVRT